MKAQIFTGVIPALMTPCKEDRTPDFDALVRKGQELIAQRGIRRPADENRLVRGLPVSVRGVAHSCSAPSLTCPPPGWGR